MKEHLINAGPERLAEILIHLQESYPNMEKQFEMIFQGLDPNPKKLFSMIKKELASLKRAKGNVRDQKVITLRDRLNQLRFSIFNDVRRSSVLVAQELMWELLKLSGDTLNRVLDQKECIYAVFVRAIDDLGKLYKESPYQQIEMLVQLIFDFVMETYLPYTQMIFAFKDALGNEGLNLLRDKLIEVSNEKTIRKTKPKLQDIADCKKDVDLYIHVSQLVTPLTLENHLDIAERLIEKWRGEEALDWLAKSETLFPYPLSRKAVDLGIQALELIGKYVEAQTVRIEYFINTLDTEMYGEVLKYEKQDKKEAFMKEAIQYAFDHEDPYMCLDFLIKLRELEEAARFVCSHIDRIDPYSSEFLKEIALELLDVNPLASVLLYRHCIIGACDRYYEAARYYLEYGDIQDKVTDWKGLENHETYQKFFKGLYEKNYNFKWAYRYERERYIEKYDKPHNYLPLF